MIFTEKKITISNNQCKIDSPVVLYRGDYNVEVRFIIVSSPYKYSNKQETNVIEQTEASYGQLVIKTPGDKAPIFSEITATKRGAITFTITAEMIDEVDEIGDYTFQIRLLDENKESRATIPEVKDGIEIREPIAQEDVTSTNEVNVATVGYALTTAGTTEDAFDSQGNYNKTTWGTGDRITDVKLNKIEAAIDGVNKKVASGGTGSAQASTVSIQDTANNFTSTNVEGALAELFQSVSNGKSLIASAITDKGVSTSNTATFQQMATNIGNISSTGGDTTQYSVTYNLSNVTSSNTATSVNAGDPYTTTLTANSGYQLNTPVVTVDGLDVTSKYYSNGIFTINNVFGNIVITADATKIIIGEGLTLNYTFNNQTAGNGYGTISLLASSDDTAGTYTIQYADDNGALSNYDNICTLTTTNGQQADYTHFIKDQMIPKYATKIIAVKDNQTKAEFVIPETKRFISGNYGQHLYSFGAISDLHVAINTWDTDFQEALTYFNDKENIAFTCIAGDITNGGKEEYFQRYKNKKDTYSPNTHVYATNGNHEWDNTSFNDTLWDTYMDNKRTCLFTQGNDVFIMLGTEKKGSAEILPSAEKQWVELQLEKYSNCRVFIFCHYFINGTDNGNYAKWDDDNVFSTSNANGQWLLGLLQQYKNAFYVSGHSHFKFILQELNPKANVCNEYNSNEIGYLWHLASITAPRDVIDGSRTSILTAESEGVVVDVYENCILFRGRNFVDKKFLPIAQYIIPKTEGTLPDTSVYTVKTTLQNATSSNTVTSVVKNSSYTTTITATDGYSINKITVIMGVTDISSTAVSGNTITIDSVTDDLIIKVVTINSASEVITPTWTNGGINASTGQDITDPEGMRSSYMEFDTNAYTYYITVTNEFEGINKLRVAIYNPDGSFVVRQSYTSTSLTPGVPGAIAFPITSGKFRLKVDFISTNTLENINSRLVITKVAKEPSESIPGQVALTWETGNIIETDGSDKSSLSSMRSNYIEVDTNYNYYVTVTNDYANTGSTKCYFYKSDGTYISRKDYSTSSLSPGVAKAIKIPSETSKFRFRTDLGKNTNTLENMNNRFIVTKVAK